MRRAIQALNCSSSPRRGRSGRASRSRASRGSRTYRSPLRQSPFVPELGGQECGLAAPPIDARRADDIARVGRRQEVDRDVRGRHRLARLQRAEQRRRHAVVDHRERDGPEQPADRVQQVRPDRQPDVDSSSQRKPRYDAKDSDRSDSRARDAAAVRAPVGDASAPPSTTIRWPLTKSASSDTRKRTTRATSAGRRHGPAAGPRRVRSCPPRRAWPGRAWRPCR